MLLSLSLIAAGGYGYAAMAQPVAAEASSAQQQLDAPASPSQALPQDPKGQSTVIGGRIKHLDRVRDKFSIEIYGGHSMKVLYDPRTKLYRDGVAAPLSSLKSNERAAVQTTLDGTKVFALSIHILTKAPQGACTGQVESYDATTKLLAVRCGLDGKPVDFLLPKGVSIRRIAQQQGVSSEATPGELTRGSLVSLTFRPGTGAQAIAEQISITASPGGSFVFRGNLVFVDIPAGRLVVQDAKSDSNYSIDFAPQNFPVSSELHPGVKVTVVADFDGTHYAATSIKAD